MNKGIIKISEDDEVGQGGMTPEQIESALIFFDAAKGRLYKSDPLYQKYVEQIECLMLAQRYRASVVFVIKRTDGDAPEDA